MPVHRKKQRKTPSTSANGYPKGAEAAAAKALEESKAKALECKAAGNEAFAKQEWLKAIEDFTQAIALDSSDHVFYSNRSAANLALKRTSDAVDDARDCVRLAPTWVKGYSRLGAALWADRQLESARETFTMGLKLEKTDAMEQSLKELNVDLEAERAAEKEAAKEAPAPAPVAYDPVIGIDLGTTYSAVAVWDVQKQGVVMLQDESGASTVPSYVGWTEDGARIVGERAKQLAARAPGRVLYDIKRLIGRKIYECKDEKFPFEVVGGEEDRVEVKAAGKTFVPEQVSAMVLARMKEIAEARLSHPVTKAVVTVPAYFNDAQRKSTQAAGAIAGLEVLRIINEPTAAALGYGLDQKEKFGRTEGADVLVFDFGGGTFDVSVLRIEDGIMEVKATGGDTRLGGEDLDHCVSAYILAELKQKGKDVKDPKIVSKVRRAAENAKRDLSTKQLVQVELEPLGGEGEIELSRAKLEELCKPLFDRCLDTVTKVLADAKLTMVDDIVLVGGSTRVPYVQEQLVEMFGKPLCKSIHPDEAVAYGAAVQGAILSGVRTAATQDLLLIDVTPLSLGIELQGKHFSIIIPRNTSIPCTKTKEYTTVENYQEEIDVPVYEGERPCIDQNRLLGEFVVTGIERAKMGEAKVEVTFKLDANGVLNVVAQDKKTKARAQCTINNACKGLDAAEIARMVGEAEEAKEEDAEYEKKLEMKSELEDAAYSQDDEELLQWLDGLVLTDTPMKVLESKRRDLRKSGA